MNSDQIAWLFIGLIILSTVLIAFALIFVSHLYNRRERLNELNYHHERMLKEHGVDMDVHRERSYQELQDARAQKHLAGENKSGPGPSTGAHI